MHEVGHIAGCYTSGACSVGAIISHPEFLAVEPEVAFRDMSPSQALSAALAGPLVSCGLEGLNLAETRFSELLAAGVGHSTSKVDIPGQPAIAGDEVLIAGACQLIGKDRDALVRGVANAALAANTVLQHGKATNFAFFAALAAELDAEQAVAREDGGPNGLRHGERFGIVLDMADIWPAMQPNSRIKPKARNRVFVPAGL